MFSVKFDLVKKSNLFEKTINNILKYIKGEMSRDLQIVKDSKTIEMASGKLDEGLSSHNVELTIKKIIPINISTIDDRGEIDRLLNEIKNFCTQAEKIESYRYKGLIERFEDENKIK